MKTIVSAAATAFLLVSCNIKSEFPGNFIPKEGKGPVTDKAYRVDFNEIRVAQSINADVIKADEEKVVISAPSDIMEDVLVENSGGKLYIHFKPGLNISSKNVSAKIYARDFSVIHASSSAFINVRDKFTQDATDIGVSSSGTIKGDFEANNLNIDVSSSGTYSGKIWAVNLEAEASSSGEISVSGKTKNANFSASSSGTVDAKNVIAENAELAASSSGDLILGVSNSVNAAASSSGDITVHRKGNLNIQSQKESSGGSITIQ